MELDQPLSYDAQYKLLRSQGLTSLAASVEMCRANAGRVYWILHWLSTSGPDAGYFRDWWVARERAAAHREDTPRTLTGWTGEGCYFYRRSCRRPDHTTFIRWENVERINIKDGLNSFGLEVFSIEQGRRQELRTCKSIPGFMPLVQEVSRRFFGAPDYLEKKFENGGHPVRIIQVWPEERRIR